MITLQQIKANNPCIDGWRKVKAANTDAPFPVSSILESNDFYDTLWALRCLPEYDNLWRKYAWWCAKQVSHLSGDPRVEECLAVVWRHSEGGATDEELAAVYSTAGAEAATRAAARAAGAIGVAGAVEAKLKQILDAGEWVE